MVESIYKVSILRIIVSYSILTCGNVFGLNILIVTNKFPYQARHYLNNQITGLAALNHEISLLAFKQLAPVDDLEMQDALSNRIYYDMKSLEGKKFDVIICQFGGTGNTFLKDKKRYRIGGKVIVFFRGGDVTNELQSNPFKYELVFKKADLIMTVCDAFKQRLIAFGCPKNKIIVHRSGILLDQFPFCSRNSFHSPLRILSVGRLVDMKGFIYVLEAVKNMYKEGKSVEYHIFGTGPLFSFLNDYINNNGLQKYVFLRGYADHCILYECYKEMDILVVPSITTSDAEQEGIPNVLMEGMATGLFVIATNHSGIPELIKHKLTGYLIPEKDSKAIQNAINYFEQHIDHAKKMAFNARHLVVRNHNSATQNLLLESRLYNMLSIKKGRNYAT